MAKKRRDKPATPKTGIEGIRGQIDAVDRSLHELINQRAHLARQAGISKHKEGRVVDFYRPEREAEVLRMAMERNDGPLRDEEILRLFREIMSACLAQEKPLKVAYLGPEGTFTQQAVLKHFGHSVRALSLASIDEVFQEVQAGNADFGVVPVENSAEGTVNNTLDRFPPRACISAARWSCVCITNDGPHEGFRRGCRASATIRRRSTVPRLARRASAARGARAVRAMPRCARARDEKGTARLQLMSRRQYMR